MVLGIAAGRLLLHRAAPCPLGPPLIPDALLRLISPGDCEQLCPRPLLQKAKKIKFMAGIALRFVKNGFWLIMVFITD